MTSFKHPSANGTFRFAAATICVNVFVPPIDVYKRQVMDQAKCREVKHKLTGLIDKEHDSLRFYYLGNNYKNKVEHIGVKPSFNVEEDVLFI